MSSVLVKFIEMRKVILFALSLIQIISYFTTDCQTDLEWIDPFKLESKGSDKLACITPAGDVLTYYKRTVNLILQSVIIENSDPDTYKGRLFVDIRLEDYTFLKKFATLKIEEPLTLQKVDQILTKVFTKSTIDELSDVFIYWSDYIYLAFFNRTTGVYLTITVVLIVIYKLLKASYTPWQVIVYLLFLGYLLDFAFTWKRLMQELEINQYADSLKYNELPVDCKLTEMSGWKFFLSFISGANKCREYHKIILYDVFWDVGPLDVIAHQSRVFLGIASNIGIGLSKLTSGLMSDLPFPLNIILLPVLLLFVLFLVWSFLTYLTDTHIDLNLFHLIYIKFKTNQSIKDKSEGRRKKHREETEEIEAPKHEKRRIQDKKKKEKRRNVDKHEDYSERSCSEKDLVESMPMP